MTACSGGVEWSHFIKPLLSASYGSVCKSDVQDLVKAINKSKEEILHHEDNFDSFYAAFCPLAADFIATNSFYVSTGFLGQATTAAKILLQYLLSRVGQPPILVSLASSTGLVPGSSAEASIEADVALKPITPSSDFGDKEKTYTIQDKHFLGGIRALCRGMGALQRPDKVNLVAVMKSAKLPTHIKTSSSTEKEATTKEPRRSRTDTSAAILEQFLSPVHDMQDTSEPPEKDVEANIVEAYEDIPDATNLFGTRCISAMQGICGGEILIDICLKLPTIQKYTQRYKDMLEGKGHGYPTSLSESLSLKTGLTQILMDLTTVWRILSLPVLEPLAPTRLHKLTTIVMSGLLASVSVAIAVGILNVTQPSSSSKTPPLLREEDLDVVAPQLTEKALDIFNIVLNAIRSSTRAGGHTVQNVQLMGAWLLMGGMNQLILILSAVSSCTDKKDEKGRSPSRKDASGTTRVNLNRVQQGFGVLCVALASQGITLLTGLLEDVRVEGWAPGKAPEAARLEPLGQFTATERLARIFNALPLNQLLYYVAIVSYKKSCSLKRVPKVFNEGDTFSISDSTTYYEDEFSEESLEEEDEDSVLIGSWFEEQPASVQGSISDRPAQTSSPDSSAHLNVGVKVIKPSAEPTTLVPDKGEPHGFISLASHTFLLMNNYLIDSECAYVQQYVRAGLGEMHMVILAAIIRDLDKESARSCTGTFALGSVLGTLYDEFSQALYKYTHNIIASLFLSDNLQTTLLTQLGVSPWTQDGDWPLQVLPRTLSVLAQVLLLRQRRDSGEIGCDSDVACVQIWQRLVKTLTKSILNSSSQDTEQDDLNVEHAQLLLFLFHSLQLMQKKNVLLNVASALVTISPVIQTPMRDMQILHMSRLLVLLDYLIKNLYEAPQALIDQIQWNLFKQISSPNPQSTSSESHVSRKLFHAFYNLEEEFQTEEFARAPTFYTLTPCETNFQETPKLDGLACSFILATPDVLKYSTFYETILNLLNIGCQLDQSVRKNSENPLSFRGLCAVQYTFVLAFRTFLIMPPSESSLETLGSSESSFQGPMIFHPAIWAPRATNKTFIGWIKDLLVRQGVTTQKSDSLLKAVSNASCSLQCQMKLVGQLISSLLSKDVTKTDAVSVEEMPNFSEIFLLDAVLARLIVNINEICSKEGIGSRPIETSELFSALKISPDQVPVAGMLALVLYLTKVTRLSLTRQIKSDEKLSAKSQQAYASMLAISGTKVPIAQGCFVKDDLPGKLQVILKSWNDKDVRDFTSPSIWKLGHVGELVVGENQICSVTMGHFASLSTETTFTMNAPLKHLLLSMVTFITDVVKWYPETDKNHSQIVSTLIALSIDSVCDHLCTHVKAALLCTISSSSDITAEEDTTPTVQASLHQHNLVHVYKLFELSVQQEKVITRTILDASGVYLDKLLESPIGQKSLKTFFENVQFSTTILQPLSALLAKSDCANRLEKCSLLAVILKFLTKLLQMAEKSPVNENLIGICQALSLVSWIEKSVTEEWFLLSLLEKPYGGQLDCWALLKSLSALASVLDFSLLATQSFVTSLIPIGDRMIEKGPGTMKNLGKLLRIMHSLVITSGEGHITIFNAVAKWVSKAKDCLGGESDQKILDTLSQILPYVSDVIVALKINNKPGAGSSGLNSPPFDADCIEDCDWMEDIGPDEDDSVADDSDDDNLSNRLCTFTLTQKDFMNQHWYHCHTCKMIDGVGVCTVCAKVCHKGHDITYAKYGSFFCDCGAKEDSSCQALVRRPASNVDVAASSTAQPGSGAGYLIQSFLRRAPSSPTNPSQSSSVADKKVDESQKSRKQLAKIFESCQEKVLAQISDSDIGSIVLDLLQTLIPTIKSLSLENCSIGSYNRVMEALIKLHTEHTVVGHSENLMIATLGSQEGAFENMRQTYTGEQGQAIKQLVNSNSIHKVLMCAMTSPLSRRQHLAVCHEKGKITILQLTSLLKQHDSAKKKLTLHRLSSSPIPFTALSITANPINDDYLAVCGLKDCHVLIVNAAGIVEDHNVLHPQLETGNYIIRAIWLPGQQTQLAVVTADFIKIYDLSVDFLCPQYFFQMPSGKIKDACFLITEDNNYHLVMMSVSGYMFTNMLCEESSAKHGPFYVTNVLQTNSPDMKDVEGDIWGGGVSIYYSHTLQLLCFSYVKGVSFLAPLKSIGESVVLHKIIRIPYKYSFPLTTTLSEALAPLKQAAPPLYQWSEVPGHPGLIICMAQGPISETGTKALPPTATPIVIMVTPGSVVVQELKVAPKTKIADMVGVRHTLGPSSDAKTTLILLCEDGSLRIFNANPLKTGYWLSPQMQEVGFMASVYPNKRKKSPRPGRLSGSFSFPVDFFEHCTPINDLEFGGGDLLHIYNTQQIKTRLNNQGSYIASSRPDGFTMEVKNHDSNVVVCGMRIGVGAVYPKRCPSYIQIFGRTVQSQTNRRRYFDIPFTRDECLRTDKMFTIFFGPSEVTEQSTIVDTVKLYGKTKEDFGWPEEMEDLAGSATSNGVTSNPESGYSLGTNSAVPATPTDMVVSSALEILDGCITVESGKCFRQSQALDLSTQLLGLPLSTTVLHQARILLSSLHPTKVAYHNHKDAEQLRAVVEGLNRIAATQKSHMDCEAFHRYLIIARNVAFSRPQNLVKFTSNDCKDQTVSEVDTTTEGSSDCEVKTPPFLKQLVAIFWALHEARSPNVILTLVCQPGLTHPEASIYSIIEIIHGFTVVCSACIPYAVTLYTEFLLSTDQTISFSAKQALIKVLRPKIVPKVPFTLTPQRESSAGPDGEKTEQNQASDGLSANDNPPVPDGDYEVSNDVMEVLRAHGAAVANAGPSAAGAAEGVDQLMGGMLDIHADDDDAMVELAIALSLHEENEEGGAEGDLHQGLEGLVGLQLQGLSGEVLNSLFRSTAQQQRQAAQMANVLEDAEDDHDADEAEAAVDIEHFSDTTVSANASDDDEGSTAATDGGSNLMMASSADQPGSGGSESGGSVVESIGGEQNISTISSVFGETTADQSAPNEALQTLPSTEEADDDVEKEAKKLRTLRATLLLSLMEKIPSLKNIPGVRSIPFLQVILMLATNLNGSDKQDKATLESLLNMLVDQIDFDSWEQATAWEKTPDKEVQLVILRLLSGMMGRNKNEIRTTVDSSTLAYITAETLIKAKMLDHCLSLLVSLLDYWRKAGKEVVPINIVSGGLLKIRASSQPPDMSPFFQRQFVKGHPMDIFSNFPNLLTEMLLRIPYQIKKYKNVQLESEWVQNLCEYTMTQQMPVVKRQIRKLLLFICGSKESYRLLRDLHALDHHVEDIKALCSDGGFTYPGKNPCSPISLPYDSIVKLIEHMKACVEIGVSRTNNWRSYCVNDETVLPYLMEVSCLLEEGVAPTILQALQTAICPHSKDTDLSKSNSVGSGRSKRSTSVESNSETKRAGDVPDLVGQINRFLDKSVLVRFVNTFLLESNSTSVRWQAHSLICALYQHSNQKDQESLLTIMWSLWNRLPSSGRKAAQFVDLLGYFSLRTENNEVRVLEEIGKAINVLQSQSHTLAHHPNANLYNSLSSLVESDGYFLESEPCLVCNNPEVAFTTVKLASIRADSRYTTKAQLVKLATSHMISRLNLRISDVKRTKMVHVLNIYYNNRSQGVVELKNKPALWHKAKCITLTNGQVEVKVDFPLPIIACNLMFEYSEFYENLQATTETLQCPRCSAAVPAVPGVCNNCGENVFQCHKCRAINYDEKDPFLCNACGYCKYAKFEYSFQSRPCCAVEPIENEEDRQKAVVTIDQLLEQADDCYKMLQGYKPSLEKILLEIGEQDPDSSEATPKAVNTHVNRFINHLAVKYCGDCKTAFDDLTKIVQKVQASRRELVAFDRQLKEGGRRILTSPVDSSTSQPAMPQQLGRCFGCASYTAQHCITLLRALAINPKIRQGLCQLGLIQNLVEYNLRRGNRQVRTDVRDLLCLLTKDDAVATAELNQLIVHCISTALSQTTSPELANSVKHEMALLAAAAKKEDSCWEQRLRCVMEIFVMAGGCNATPMVMEHITLPCLRMLLGVIQPMKKKTAAEAVIDAIATATSDRPVLPQHSILEAYSDKPQVGVCVDKWLVGDPDHTFDSWKKRTTRKIHAVVPGTLKKYEVRQRFLTEKYASKWLMCSISKKSDLTLSDGSWIKKVLFNPSSRLARQVSTQLVNSLCSNPLRRKTILDLLTSFLPEIGRSGESSEDFVALYQKIVNTKHWKYYLALKGVLPTIADLIMVEIKRLSVLEETTLAIDLSQGYALKVLTDLLSSFVAVEGIKRTYKGRLLRTVLTGYLSLRKLIVQRTKLVDDTQNKFLELLEHMTSGNNAETQEFMTVCVDTLSQYPADDLRTPVFIFERLCSIIYPEENDVGDFSVTLEKDPLQEDFLQGRMVGNPYKSHDAGLGPLMRDIKIKICQDCELVALLDEENSMELLICNKIISLDLPVKEVFKKVWAAEYPNNPSMRIVYRMRGLLGDATEEFVETFDKQKEDDVDNEKVYGIASVMTRSNGLKVMLDYLQRITDLSHAKPLVAVLLKLFDLCNKLTINRNQLADPTFGAIPVLLHTLKQCLAAEPEVVVASTGGATFTEQILVILESILVQASTKPPQHYAELVEACGLEDIHLLLNYCATSSRTNTQVRERLMRVLPCLVFGNKEKMELLIGHFKPILEFERFDASASTEDHAKMEAFCVFCAGIERNHIGKQLQDMLIVTNIVKDSLTYIEKHIPETKKFFGTCDDEWKEFISKPSLKYILRILTGLATKHLGTQQAVATSCIPAIHRLEQISSDEHVGSLAENLLEALKDDPAIVQLVKDTRRQTRQEKKQLAMKTRKMELERLGLIANEKEQITSGSSLLKQMDDLTEESGLTCAICLEGYRCHPTKTLAIYTFTKKCPAEEFDKTKGKNLGYSTVSHFNVVHVDCHLAAVRVSHPRDEWDRAALHNANTKANGLLPLWGPLVPESAFASCLARHNTYLLECTGYRDVGYSSTLCDIKLLLLRFAQEKSFSDESGGGGPQSNMNLLPYLLHISLYILNTTRSHTIENTRLDNFMISTKPNWVNNSFEVEGPFFMCVLSLAVSPISKWKETRIKFLMRLLVTNHVRSVCGQVPVGGKVHDKSVQPWQVYKSAAVFWALIDNIYNTMFKKVSTSEIWSINLADYIRQNDQILLEASSTILATYQADLITASSFTEFVDATGLLSEIEQPEQYLSDTLQSLP